MSILQPPGIASRFGDPGSDGETILPEPGNAGTLLHRKQGDYLIQRGSHSSHSRVYPKARMYDFKEAMKATPPEYGHLESFVQACMGNATTESAFRNSALLTQVLTLGTIAEYLNVDLKFDPKKRRFIRNEEANALLSGPPPQKEWAHYYTLA